ncbi:MAG: hypothetical protein ACK4SZ_07385 [Allosphingosinicella sp.]|uniref:hypothetical protein n=1 Tax=Allosphingosinicella sp. TaxID=2823234 RepID=UPI0039401023
MKPERPVTRRSFFSIVAGGAAAGSLGLVSGSASGAQGCSDTDPLSRGGDPGGQGRHCRNLPQTGCSDSDPTDPGGRGRNCQSRPQTGCSDTDPTDPVGAGRTCQNRPHTGCTDRDPTDPGGRGRNCAGGGASSDAYPIGRRERRYEVCWVDHPSRSNDECNLQIYSEWATTYSDGSVRYDTTEAMARRGQMERSGYTARWHRMLVDEWRGLPGFE